MQTSRLMDRPEDFERLGLSPDTVENWEDGKRNGDGPNEWEWWYFDTVLDDGSTLVIQFIEKSFRNVRDDHAHPSVLFQLTLPNGTKREATPEYPVGECTWGKDGCDVRFGPNVFQGDLRDYHIKADVGDGLAADIDLHSLTSPYRPGTGYFGFDDDREFYTWFCTVPKGEVTGTLAYDGEVHEVHGFGYHDHQWGNSVYYLNWNHWTWARQSYDDYTLLWFPMITAKKYGSVEYPIIFVQDADGKIVFQSTKGGSHEVLEVYVDDVSGKTYPAKQRFSLKRGGDEIVYTLEKKEVLRSAHPKMPFPANVVLSMRGLNPSYARFLGVGRLDMTLGGVRVEREADLIYEFMFPGKKFD
jgi:hypothetical protein